MTASNTHDDQEMSMDEILASIRRYVSSDEPSSKSDLKPVDSGPKKVVVPDPAHIQQPAPRLDIPKLNLNDDIVRLNDTGRDVGREAVPSDAGRNTARMDSRAEVRNSDVRDGDTRGQTKRFDPPFNNDLSIKQPQPNRFEPSLVTKLRPAADIQESTPESFSEPSIPDRSIPDQLVSDKTLASTMESFARLRDAAVPKAAAKSDAAAPSPQTLDQLFEGLARPMISEWLERNLPQMVERMVMREIERITKS